jgi:hypothetical protein
MLRTTATAISASQAYRCVTVPIAGMDRWYASKLSRQGPCHADHRPRHHEHRLGHIHHRFSHGISRRKPQFCLLSLLPWDGGASVRTCIQHCHARVAQSSAALQPCATQLPASSDPCAANACAVDSIPIARHSLGWRLSPTGSLAYRSRNDRSSFDSTL